MDFITHLSWHGALSYFGSSALFLFAIWGIIWFFPRKQDRGNSGPKWLILAIWLGFLGNGFNSFIWQVFSDPAVYYGVMTPETMRLLGAIFGDFFGKGAAALSIYLHFYARWSSLSHNERSQWSPLLMGLYPDTSSSFYRLTMRAITLMRNNALTRNR